jgi:uncharacterized protein involved in tellurium resistance
MTKPIVVTIDVPNNIHIEREMTDEEYAQYLIDLAEVN